jgi:hypothetical protein
MTPASNAGFLQSVGENFHVNFVVKEFPVDNSKFGISGYTSNRMQNPTINIIIMSLQPFET